MKSLFSNTIIAHRGASAYAPENTMAAFHRAYVMGAAWVEFDVMLAACGTPIIFHDETLNRTTNAVGPIAPQPYAALQTLDAGSWFSPWFSGERIPTLKSVLMFLKSVGMRANIEIKPLPHQSVATVEHTLAVVRECFDEAAPGLLFSSFDVDALRALRQASPHAHIGLLMHEWLPEWERIASELRTRSIHLNHEILTPKTASLIKGLHQDLLCYTVNDRDTADRLFSWGVDGVFSDFPDVLVKSSLVQS